ncbi:MAG TPA: tRNA (adenosine(37)-N6)-threonylcarbamoyltransferase complex dimerization subunit type 1 TsaB [Bacilli bacterium]|nr:tRNA (adenosine(37)-N6)-threonylcarbamoyltransferase complex dimerization subunit type 1 TsaB [Bacilli bacterium]
MKSLLIDSSRNNKSMVSYIKDDRLLFTSEVYVDKNLSSSLLPSVEKCLSVDNSDISLLDKIYVINGPGSFTGLRIGITIAKVIAWSLNKKIYTISSLFTLSSEKNMYDYNLSILYDKDDSAYFGLYNNKTTIFEVYSSFNDVLGLINKEKINTLLINTDDDNEYLDEFIINLKKNINTVSKNINPKIDIFNIIEKGNINGKINPHDVNPVYLKQIEVEK